MPDTVEVAATRARIDISGLTGLSETEAAARLAAEGPNELPSQNQRGVWAIAWEVVREPMFLLLSAAGGLYVAMGETSDAVVLLASVLVVLAITVIQERRTERALEALRDLSSPRALVIRGGMRRRVAGREVVRGDLLVLCEGDRVPADALLRQAINLSADESALTGESVPVQKLPSATAGQLDAPGGDDRPSLFSGTVITAGQGIAEVMATGAASELGRIGRALKEVTSEPTPLQLETRRLVRLFAAVGFSACALVVVGYALSRGGDAEAWKAGVLAGIALAMSVLPEEFPVVLTVFLAIGAWRLSRRRVLARRMPAIETLGETTVLCVDKTGTLTQNQMSLRWLGTQGQSIELLTSLTELPEEFHEVLENAILASKPDPFDPMERALREVGQRLLGTTEHLHPDWQLVREYALSEELRAVSHAWATPGGELVVASKGSPEAIVDLCHVEAATAAQFLAHARQLAGQGLRVLGVARGVGRSSQLPAPHHDLELQLLGLLGFEDPIRPAVPSAVADCLHAGIRVVMITGDYPETARSIARQAGLPEAEVVTGPELRSMSDAELERRITTVGIFARVVPQQKLRLVQALKARGEVVAMTGDGVNDAPALKAAHIGVAMGERGTDVAREASSLVLLDDDFSSIVAAVRMGRRIFDNIRKAVAFILAVHVPVAGLSLLPVFYRGWPLLLLPVHIAFLELIIDPACTLIFEAEDEEVAVMARPPRSRDERLFSPRLVWLSLLQGLSVLTFCLGVFFISKSRLSAEQTRALTFAALVLCFLWLILVNRSWSRSAVAMMLAPNAAFGWVLSGTLLFLGAVLWLPWGQRLFHFGAVPPSTLAAVAVLTAVPLVWFEVFKRVRRARPAERLARQPSASPARGAVDAPRG